MTSSSAIESFRDYASRLSRVLVTTDWQAIETLAVALQQCHQSARQVFICGNGGSAANALHIVNDFFYGIAKKAGPGLRAQALTGNVSLLTCLANDEGYDKIFARQLATLAQAGDILIVLSGSGNSANIVEALQQARQQGLTSFAILGYSGGKALHMADHPLHFAVDDMQIAEDTQLIVGHMLMQWLSKAEAAQE